MATATITLGGSDAAAACGLDPFRSRVQLWLERTGRVVSPDMSEAMLWGTLLEPVIAAEVESRGYAVLPAPTDPYVDGFMHGHLDGFAASPDWYADTRGVLEIKTASAYRSRDWADNQVPPAYQIQVHHYMHLAGLNWALVACLIGGQRLELRTVERDDRLIDVMLALEEEFVSLVQSDTPPAPDGSDSADEMIRLLHPESSGEVIQATSADYELIERVRVLKAAAKAAEHELAGAEQELKMRLGDAEALWFQGRKLVSWPTVRSQRLDSTALKAELPEIAAKYMKTSTYRTLRVAS